MFSDCYVYTLQLIKVRNQWLTFFDIAIIDEIVDGMMTDVIRLAGTGRTPSVRPGLIDLLERSALRKFLIECF